jgi:hypothetical protein
VKKRNCDIYRDVEVAYERFVSYVRRENPASVKPSPLHTVWDVLKWVLGVGDGEYADSLKHLPTTQEDCWWVVCSYGHLLPVQAEGSEERITGKQFAQMIRDNYDMTYGRNALAAHYAEDGIYEVWYHRFGGDLGDGFNWMLNKWVEGLSFPKLEGVAGRKRKEGV